MGAAIGGSSEYNSDINVTPMVDIMLVLLIVFMIVTPLLQQGVTVDLPKNTLAAVEDEEIAKDTSVVVSIPNNGQFFIGKDAYPLDLLGEKIKLKMEGRAAKKRIVYIKAGINVEYGTVVQAIDAIRKQDIDKVGLVADKKKDVAAEE